MAPRNSSTFLDISPDIVGNHDGHNDTSQLQEDDNPLENPAISNRTSPRPSKHDKKGIEQKPDASKVDYAIDILFFQRLWKLHVRSLSLFTYLYMSKVALSSEFQAHFFPTTYPPV